MIGMCSGVLKSTGESVVVDEPRYKNSEKEILSILENNSIPYVPKLLCETNTTLILQPLGEYMAV